MQEGYQSQIILDEDFDAFVKKTKVKSEFDYDYITDKTKFSSIRMLAHIFFKTPFFPNEWRK